MSDPLISVNSLTPHPRNLEFFDESTGQSWEDFLQSVRTSDVREPIVIDQNNMIISGHMRVRACKELGIPKIKYTRVVYDSDDQRLKDLIELNIKQRGIGNPNPVKFGRCIKELERIYGIQHGGDRKSDDFRESKPNISVLKTQSDFATQLGISADTLRNYKQLAESIPEIQDLITTGIITPSAARAIIKKLPEDQQRKLAQSFADKSEKVTNKELKEKIEKLESTFSNLKKEPEVKEVFPDDYEELKRNNELLSSLQKGYEATKLELEQYKAQYADPTSSSTSADDQLEKLRVENEELRSKNESIQEELSRLTNEQYSKDGKETNLAYDFNKEMIKFIEKYSKLLYQDFFKNNCDNSKANLVLNAANNAIDFLSEVIKKCQNPDTIDM